MDQLKKRGCTLFIFLFLCPFSLYLPHLRYFFSFLLSKESFTPVCLLLHSCLSRFVTLIPSIFILWLILCFVFSLQGFHCCSFTSSWFLSPLLLSLSQISFLVSELGFLKFLFALYLRLIIIEYRMNLCIANYYKKRITIRCK